MKRMCIVLILFAIAGLPLAAQSPTSSASTYELPFASSGSQIEIAVKNASGYGSGMVTVDVERAPSWLRFEQTRIVRADIPAGAVGVSTFTFSVDRSAPVGVPQTVLFAVSAPDGQRWTREVHFSVAAPDRSELLQNYPNPFNPSTTIPFVLAAPSVVCVKAYDVTGREVATLLNEPLPAGEHRAVFRAEELPSGAYMIRLVASEDNVPPFVAHRAVLLVK